jgi:hypothetical protein
MMSATMSTVLLYKERENTMIPSCLCGYPLRGETERTKGWCVDCSIRIALYEERVKVLLTQTHDASHWTPILSTMQQALYAERMAMERTSFVHEGYAQAYCEALRSVGVALTHWIQADHLFWLLLLHLENSERTMWEDLHNWCVEERERIYMLYAMLNISVQQHCYLSFFTRREQPSPNSSLQPVLKVTHVQKTSLLSPCHHVPLYAARADGVIVGSCPKCDEDVVRVNPCTGRQEWLDGHSPWSSSDLRPVEAMLTSVPECL